MKDFTDAAIALLYGLHMAADGVIPVDLQMEASNRGLLKELEASDG